MFKVKHLALAAAVALSAVSMMASNFRAADQVYLPAAGRITGGGVTFISDVWVQNMTNDPVTVSVIYTATFAGSNQAPQYANDLFSLAPRERREFVDFVGANRATGNGLGLDPFFGTLIFNACRQGADCTDQVDEVTGVDPDFRDIAVFSRIYSIPVGGNIATSPSNGQAFPGIPWYNYVSSRASNIQSSGQNLSTVVITGLRNTGAGGQAGTYRGNIGFMNASQFSTTTIRVRLYRGNAPDTVVASREFTVAPLNHIQMGVSAMFGDAFPAGLSSTNAFVRIDQTNSVATSDAPTGCQPDGCPGFIAYGSVLDNLTSDATTLEAIYEFPLSLDGIDTIYGSSAGKPNVRRAARRRP